MSEFYCTLRLLTNEADIPILDVVTFSLSFPFVQGEKPIPAERLARIEELIEPWFIFSVVWSIGMTGDNDGQSKFSDWMKDKMKKEGVSRTHYHFYLLC